MSVRWQNRYRLIAAFVLALLGVQAGHADEKTKTLDIYCIDISASVGNATLIVTPSGETMLLDAGTPRHTEHHQSHTSSTSTSDIHLVHYFYNFTILDPNLLAHPSPTSHITHTTNTIHTTQSFF